MTLIDNRIKNLRSGLRTNAMYTQSGNEYYSGELQYKINEEFMYASDVYTIQEELVKGSTILFNTSTFLLIIFSFI